MEANQESLTLGQGKISRLLLKFSIPCVMGLLISALYNIVDQIFIGQGVGMLGNAATNIAFPIAVLCTATALTFGIGSASNYNLESGRGNTKKATEIISAAVLYSLYSHFGYSDFFSQSNPHVSSAQLYCDIYSPKNSGFPTLR